MFRKIKRSFFLAFVILIAGCSPAATVLPMPEPEPYLQAHSGELSKYQRSEYRSFHWLYP
jgi:hypothetical protein